METESKDVYCGKNGQAPKVRYNGRFCVVACTYVVAMNEHSKLRCRIASMEARKRLDSFEKKV